MKLLIKSLLFYSLFLFVYGCKVPNTDGNLDSLFSEVKPLKYKQTLVDGHIWGTPMEMLYCDSSIFIYDERSEKGLFHWIDLAKRDSVYNFGEKGQGDNEFIMPFDFRILNDTVVGIYDLFQKKLCAFDISEIKKGNYHYSVLTKDTIRSTTRIIPTLFGTFVTLGFYDNCMFKLWGGSLPNIKEYGEYPYKDSAEKKIENRMRGMAYQGFLRSNSIGDKCVYAVNSADIIYFYKIMRDNLSCVKKIEMNYPVYQSRIDGDARSAPMASTNKNTTISMCTSDKYVYLLYSGRNFKENGLSTFSGTVVYVFDWDGKPIVKYELNVPVTMICTDDNDDVLYAFSNMPDPVLLEFKLK